MAQARVSPEAIAKEGYDAQAQGYLDWTRSIPSHRERKVQELLDLLGDASSKSVLELGCGAGVPVTKTLAERFNTVAANDISSAQIALAREHLAGAANVDLIEGSMTSLEFDSGKFDAVLAVHSIIHLDPDGQKLIFDQVRRWLKPGGILLVNLATATDPGKVTEGWLGMKAAYWSSFGQDGNRKLIEEKGFEILSSEVIHEFGDAEFGWFIAKAV